MLILEQIFSEPKSIKYFNYYKELMLRAKIRAHSKKDAQLILGYFEKHHILPICMGGINALENYAFLTAREHFIAHQFLVKMFPTNKKLIYAMKMLTVNSNGKTNRNNRQYEWHKKLQSEFMSGENHPMFNKHHTEEARNKMSIAMNIRILETDGKCQSRPGISNGMFGKKHSQESRNKMSLSLKNVPGHQWTDESKKKLSATHSGENNPFFGKSPKWMFNPELNKNKRVEQTQISEYLNCGWQFGRLKFVKSN